MGDDQEDVVAIPETAEERPESHATTVTTATTAESSSRAESGSVPANLYRRRVLRYLATAETPMALADLADELVRRETDASPTAVQDERERIYLSLYHRHLPKLDDAGLVAFDVDRKLVTLRDSADELLLDDRPSADEQPRENP